MVASAPGEASGKIWSRTSPRSEDDAEALGAFAEGNVSVRTAATSDAGTGEFCGCVAVFFSAAAFSALRAPDAGDDLQLAGFLCARVARPVLAALWLWQLLLKRTKKNRGDGRGF